LTPPTTSTTFSNSEGTQQSSQSTPNNNGYPGPENPDDQTGYPAPDATQYVITPVDFTVTPEANETPTGVITPSKTPTNIQNNVDNRDQGSLTWMFGILGGIIALCIILLIIFFLWKKGLIDLPF
jgi:hypothetical protein